jgi:hypothetical protein
MKSLALIISLSFSIAALAKTPATTAFNNLLAPGTYTGLNGSEECAVTVSSRSDSVSVFVKNESASNAFTLVDGAYYYAVNDITGEISASMGLNFPGTYRGGQKSLTVRKGANNSVEFFIANVIFSRTGEEIGTYTACTVSL